MIDVSFLDQLAHVAEEKRQQQRADMRAVDVGVGHDDDLVVSQLADVEIFADAAAERLDDDADFLAAEHLVHARLFDVENLAAQGQNGLELAVASLFGAAAGRVALDDVDFAVFGGAAGAVGQLARQRKTAQRRFAHELAGFFGGFAGLAGLDGLFDDRLDHRRVFFERLQDAVVKERVDDALDVAVAQLGLGLAFELGIAQLDGEHAGQAFAQVVAGEVLVLFLEHAGAAGAFVDAASQSAAQAGHVGAAFDGVDQVGERVKPFDVLVGVLETGLYRNAVLFAADDDRSGRQRLFALVDVGDELRDAAFVMICPGLAFGFVDEDKLESRDQEGHLAEAIAQRLGRKGDLVENFRVGPECHRRAALRRRRAAGQAGNGRAALETFVPFPAVAVDRDLQPFGKRVDDRNADAVQAAGDLVIVIVELAARVQHRQHHFEGGTPVGGMRIHGNAAAVVADADALVGVQRHRDFRAEAGQRLVDRIVNHLVHAVVEPSRRRIADVHARPLADGVEPFQNLYVFGCVLSAHESLTSCERGSATCRAPLINSR